LEVDSLPNEAAQARCLGLIAPALRKGIAPPEMGDKLLAAGGSVWL
jgi:hypothetical protein